MKKIIATVLALALAFSLAGALAAPGDAMLGRGADGGQEVYYNAVFAEDGVLYLTAYNVIATYRIGEAAETTYLVEMPEYQPSNDEAGCNWSVLFFGCDGAVYAVALLSEYGDHNEFIRAALCEVSFEGEGDEAIARLTEKAELDWSDMVDYYDQESYAHEPESVLGFGGMAYMMTYDSNYDRQVRRLDLATGGMEVLGDLSDAYTIARYRDDTLLCERLEYAGNGYNVILRVYDPATGRTETICEKEMGDYDPFSSLAYDAATDTLYCIKAGEICPLDAGTGTIGAGIADAPLDAYGDCRACVMDGGYYAYACGGACVRNLDASLRNETRIKVYDGAYGDTVQNAYYRFTNAHGDISVAVSHDYNQGKNLVENMLNRDDSVDIYILSTTTEAYDAVFNRGYMMELDSSPALAALADRMYPDLREGLSARGHLMALPVTAYGYCGLAVNERALEALGLTLADVPDNWDGLLDFIDALPDRMDPDVRVSLLYEDETFEGAKRELFYQIFNDYQYYVNCTDPIIGYDTPMLRGLIEKLERIDFTRFGYEHEVPEDEQSDEDRYVERAYEGGQSLQLFETGVGCTFGNFWSESTPIVMSMTADTPHFLAIDFNVAFINPFSKHPQEAMLFMEQLAESMGNAVRYCIDPSLDQPIRSPYYDEWVKELEEYYDQLRQQLETAEAADRQMLEEELAQYEENMDQVEAYSWEISQKNLDWYRGHDDNLRVNGVNWLYTESAGGEASQLLYQYLEGMIDYRAMLSGIDKKVRMMIMEGR